MSGRSKIRIDTGIEIEEQFWAKMENIKCEEEKIVDIIPAVLPQKYEVQGFEASLKYSESKWQSNDDISLLSRCRLCALPCSGMVDIFSSPTTRDIQEKIKYSLPIVVIETDTLPKQICRFCLVELERCYRFHKTAVEAEKRLHAFEKLASMKLEKTYKNHAEYDNIDGPLATASDVETNNRLAIIRKDTQTAETVVKSNVLLLSLRPCSELSIIESSCKNSSNVENGKNSRSGTKHRNPGLTNESFDFERPIEVEEQSACDSGLHGRIKIDHKYPRNPGTHVSTHTKKRHYKCNSCTKTFKLKDSLYRHNKLHTGKGLHSCEYCEKKWTSKADKVRHQRIHTNELLFKCPTCDRWFTDPSVLKQHSVIHIEDKNYVCHLCDKSFKSSRLRKAHMVVHASNRLRVQCDYCKKHFLGNSGLRQHWKICKDRINKTSCQST